MQRAFLTYLVFSLIILSCIKSATCKLQCKHCNSNPPKMVERVLPYLAGVPGKHVCVWYLGGSSGGGDEEGLVKGLVSSGKTVTVFGSDHVDSAPPDCRHNVLVTAETRALGSLGCRSLLAPSLPLTVDYHYYVLVPGLFSASDLDLCSGQFGPARAAFVSLRDASVFTLSSPLELKRKFDTSKLSSMLNHKSMTKVNLKGRPVNVATFNCSPFVTMDNYNDIDNITGIEWNVLKAMAKIMNFTIKLVELKGAGQWGHFVNGSWSGGIMQAIQDGEAEIGICNMWFKYETWQVMEYCSPLNSVKFSFIVPRPKPLQHHWKALVQIFDRDVWILILILYLLYTVSYWKIVNVDSQKRIRPGLAKCSLTMFGSLMGTHWPPHGGRTGARLLITCWCVFVLLLTSTYNTSIAARLTLQRYEQRVDTVEQLVEQDFSWSDSPGYNNFERQTYFNFANDWQSKWQERFIHVSEYNMKAALDSGRFAFPIQRWGDMLLFINVDGIDPQHDLKSMRVLKETTCSTFCSIKFAKRSPLYKAGQLAFLRVSESGLVTHWTAVVSRASEHKFARRLLHEEEGRTDLQVLGMHNLGSAFIMLGGGLLASSLIFVCECYCKRGK